MEKEKAPGCCHECMKFEQFGKACWVYWDNKKECTQHTANNDGLVL